MISRPSTEGWGSATNLFEQRSAAHTLTSSEFWWLNQEENRLDGYLGDWIQEK